ncbi:hypothetical protein [Mangrovibacter phragmitis]|uniref:hypothetical protein n=1 Tax=Mangrovibacter phragmitis TaxID=1691903 RepID=UPI003515484A
MDNTQLEMKLRANGFSDKNIIFLRKRLQTPDGELKTLHILLSELRKRFYTSVTIAIFMFLMAGYATFARNTGNGYWYFGAIIILCIYLFAATPIGIAWKATRFLNKEG